MEGKRDSRIYRQILLHSNVFGLFLALGVNLALVVVCIMVTVATPDPPFPPVNIPLEIMEELPEPAKEEQPEQEAGAEDNVRAELPVQKSEAPVVAKNDSKAKESVVGKTGDVEVPQPEEKIDEEAIFRSPKNKKQAMDANNGAATESDRFKGGAVNGNASSGAESGASSASLKGRSVRGRLPEPKYDIQETGVVVVLIYVTPEGNVQNAIPGANGTTITNKNIWNAAKEAAMKAKFNVDSTAPGLQEGTITYKFILN